jgi:tetratricopeptide (TPR) repeat protein
MHEVIMRSTILLSLLVALTTLLNFGCEEDKEKSTLHDARKAVKASQYDLALTKFTEFLVLAPDDYNGLWGVADVYSRQGNFKKQETVLNKIMDNAEYKKMHSRVLLPALEKCYVEQGNTLLGVDITKAEEFYRKALTLNKKNALANANLAELLMNQGDTAQKNKNHKLAESSFSEAISLRISTRLRNKLKKRKNITDIFIRRDSVMPRLEKVKQALVAAGQYDPKKREFIVNIEKDVEGYPGNKKDPDFEMRAKNHGRIALLEALNDLVWKVSEKKRPENVGSIQFKVGHLKGLAKNQELVKKAKKKYAYKMGVRVARDVILYHVTEVDQGLIKQRAPPKPVPEAAAGDAKTPAEKK